MISPLEMSFLHLYDICKSSIHSSFASDLISTNLELNKAVKPPADYFLSFHVILFTEINTR